MPEFEGGLKFDLEQGPRIPSPPPQVPCMPCTRQDYRRQRNKQWCQLHRVDDEPYKYLPSPVEGGSELHEEEKKNAMGCGEESTFLSL